MTIGEVASRAGVAPSALRYYERLGLLPAPARASGRRRYTDDVLVRLRVIAFAQSCGFTLREVRELLGGRPYSTRLRTLAGRKLGELEQAAARIETMRSLLQLALRCDCLTLEQCGRRLGARGQA